ncbi:MAG: efflux RND transporter periplasmic adaptor subunit [candidate division WOR-3 bacterium]|nr:efflux RND transporter periplasmic adaptor subunit [candidate division WOR-3 bacterium]MDW8113927.1 efflux RND transporter periplasmic adaptor subunit [candidate division WOR-3 bacterium]
MLWVKRLISFKLLFLFLFLNIFSCRQKKVVKERELPTIGVQVVKREGCIKTIKLFGRVFGEEEVIVVSKIMGKVLKINKKEGDNVKVNDTIMYILNDMPGAEYQPGPVLSPINGKIGKIYVEIAQMVNIGTPVALVFSDRKLRVKAKVSERDLAHLKKGMVSYLLINNKKYEGYLEKFSPIIDPLTRGAEVEIYLKENKDLRVGMPCDIYLIVDEKRDVLTVSPSAFFLNDYSSLYVVRDDSIVEKREVKVGLIGDDKIEIVEGVKEGEKVVILGKEYLKEGNKVRFQVIK